MIDHIYSRARQGKQTGSFLLIVPYLPTLGEECCSTVGGTQRNGQQAGKKWEPFMEES